MEGVFNKIAEIYDRILPEHVADHYLKKRIKFINKFIKNGDMILDVGCGTGKFIAALSALGNGRIINGCDNSVEMLKKAQKRDNLRHVCCDSSRIPYKDNVFNIIVANVLFHHLQKEESVLSTLSEMLRVASRNAKIIIWDANPLNPYWHILFKKMPQDQGVKGTVKPEKISNFIRHKMSIPKIKIYRKGWVPDFIPRSLLNIFVFAEYILERIPVIKLFSAHYVLVIEVGR